MGGLLINSRDYLYTDSDGIMGSRTELKISEE